MAQVTFIGKGKVDGQEYNKGNTLDVDEATKSRLLKEGCIEGVGADCSELEAQLETSKKEAQAEVTTLNEKITELEAQLESANKQIEVPADFDNLLAELEKAEKIADYKAIQDKYGKVN